MSRRIYREDDPAYRRGYEDAAFDAGLDAYQARMAQEAAESDRLAEIEAQRPNAIREPVRFGDVKVNDYITNSDDLDSPWVKVVEVGYQTKRVVDVVKYGDTETHEEKPWSICFETTRPMGIGGHTRFWIERDPDDMTTRDATIVHEDVA